MAQEKTVIIKDENVNPVDALHVLQEKMLDPRAYGSCSLPKQGECLGCRSFGRCEEPTKGEGQPFVYGTRRIKSKERGGGTREVVEPCFIYWAAKDAADASGDVYKIVARAGQSILEKGSEPLFTVPNPRDASHPLPAKDTPYIDVVTERVIPEWQGIDKSERLIGAAYASAILQKDKLEREAAREIDILSEASNLKAPPDALKAHMSRLPQKPERRKQVQKPDDPKQEGTDAGPTRADN